MELHVRGTSCSRHCGLHLAFLLPLSAEEQNLNQVKQLLVDICDLATKGPERMIFNGNLMVIQWDFNGIYGGLMGPNGIL